MTRAERIEQMLAHVAEQEQSGLSRTMYCAAHGLALHVPHYWCARSKRAAHAR